jgi:hypothetical protein
MNVTEIGWEGVDWVHLAQNRDQWWTLVTALSASAGCLLGLLFNPENGGNKCLQNVR